LIVIPNDPETAVQRLTITVDDDLVAELDSFIAARGYANRSEAIRDLARSGLQQSNLEVAQGRECVATLSYVYDHAARQLPKRLTRDFHDHHNLAQATLHVHLDHDSCLEVTVLKGRSSEVKAFADHVHAGGCRRRRKRARARARRRPDECCGQEKAVTAIAQSGSRVNGLRPRAIRLARNSRILHIGKPFKCRI
jgi:CopG family transcriptional regulator, nickel-responsive regulator